MNDQQEHQRIDAELHRLAGGSDPFAAAVRATRMPMLITDPRQDDNPIVFVNDAFAKLTGYARAETLGRNCRFLQGPGTSTADVARIRDAIDRRVPIEIELLNYRRNGTTFWNKLLISPVFDSDGELTFFFASQFDVTPERERISRLATDREMLEAEIENRILDLGAAEERLRFTLQAGRLGAWTLDLPNGRLVASAQCKMIFGRPAADTFTLADIEASLVAKDRVTWREALEAAMQGEGYLEADLRIMTPDDEERWIEIRSQTRFDADSKPMTLAGVVLDITERRAAEAQRDLLTRELSHRVKNTLATVQSIVSQSLRDGGVPPTVATTIADRLQALATAHDVLTQQGWTSADIGEVVSATLAPFNSQVKRIAFGGPRVRLSARATTAIALALHELSTNAIKYGALANTTGRIRVNWELEDEHLVLSWTESDGPAVVKPSRRGFGTRLIDTALAGTTFGTVDMDFRPTGLRFTFRAPVASLVEPETIRPY
ncbi:HWE histidine kinase domain-containing protein [Devosia sp. A16]|uniref:HWE histidine kinase domain-containing protein n=1 Tax=Devosia sp. A16 TaxID=1736675 RepID=UPI0006D7AB91|nr:HWE histidine kinase domain-containing protein [Devosia sp. A16]